MAAPTQQRLPALDLARGAAVLAVVFMHACWRLAPGPGAPYTALNYPVAAVRMPLLMLLSGTLVAGYRRAPAAKVLARCTQLLWVYLLWTALLMALRVVPRSLWQLPVPGSPLWFVLALLGFTALLPLTRRVPGWLLVPLLCLPALLARNGGITLPMAYAKTAGVAPFFYLGAYAPQLLRGCARGGPGVLWPALLGVVGLHLLGGAVEQATGLRLLDLPERLAACALLLGLCPHATGLPGAGVLLRVGRNTLPVFTGHMIFVAVLAAPLAALLPLPLAAPLLALAAVLCALGLHRAALRLGCGWLYAAPAWAQAGAARALRPGALTAGWLGRAATQGHKA